MNEKNKLTSIVPGGDRVAMPEKHPFHLVDPSPWPFVAALSILVLGIGAVLSMHKIDHGVFVLGVALLVATFVGWWRDVLMESNTSGAHTQAVQNGLKIGMGLFIFTEVMFFGAFFWGYFHIALDPGDVIGGVWPPKGIITIDPFDLPYLNTLLLLLSGTSITWAHHEICLGRMSDAIKGLAVTICLGVVFTIVQALEYSHAPFGFSGGIYPSLFYMATGIHGAHIIIGTIFLIVCWARTKNGEFTATHHVGFEAAAWYWHFVDVVWLFLFVSIYWWGYVPFMGS
ncbi:MAG: cytochrome c oxidase subunit 3 [Alphaproteobacteria bacterium]|nr:cytochrome c oxidase subunit 3 [Alphaproteobacteria bacterium]